MVDKIIIRQIDRQPSRLTERLIDIKADTQTQLAKVDKQTRENIKKNQTDRRQEQTRSNS